METLTLSLSASMKEFIDAQVAENGYSTASEYICALIRADQKRQAEEKLEALLIEGLDSGPPIEVTPEFWEKKRAALLERHGKVKRA
jgi:antitoxin ParD1/3/4